MKRKKFPLCGLAMVVIWIISCGVFPSIGPTATPTLTPTPTPVPAVPFGETYKGLQWHATLTQVKEVREAKALGLVAKPKSPNRWVAVMLQLTNPNTTELNKKFSPNLINALTVDGDEKPLIGIITSEAPIGDSVFAFLGGSFTGNMSLAREGIDSMSVTGEADGNFFMDYNLQPEQTGQFGLLFSLQSEDTIFGVDLGDESPVMLAK